MKKLINYMGFFGKAASATAEFLKTLIPSWEELVKANKADKIAPPEVVNNLNVKEVTNA